MNTENISAFAFRTGRQIEEIIISETDNLQNTNTQLQAKILHFRQKLLSLASSSNPRDIVVAYDNYFGITHRSASSISN